MYRDDEAAGLTPQGVPAYSEGDIPGAKHFTKTCGLRAAPVRRPSTAAQIPAPGRTRKEMAQFFDLPRELRDMVYMAVLTHQRPRPTLGEAQWLFRFRRVFEPQSSVRGEYGCAYSLERTPSTCANFLVCNRQIYAEMSEAIVRAKRKGLVAVKLDCIAEDESFHYFTWLAAPLVKTSANLRAKPKIVPGWVGSVMAKYLTCTHRMLSGGCVGCRSSSTLIHQLRIDIRLVGDRSAKWLRNNSPPDRTAWAVCAALKRIFEKGPEFSSDKNTINQTTVEELVLNVVTPQDVAEERLLDEHFPTDEIEGGLVHPRTVARELVDVWNRIWSGEEFKGSLYQILLERIKTVRVCINEETFRVRELRLELERGQAERRRIAARVGW